MQIDVQIQGLDRLRGKFANLQGEIDREVQAGLFVVAKKIEGDAKKSILNGQKTGQIYKRGNVLHRASAPGESPANDTGRLANSINGEVSKSAMEATVKAGGGIVKYARMLEFGTIRIAPRPFMRPAVESNRNWIADRMKKAVMNAIKRVGK